MFIRTDPFSSGHGHAHQSRTRLHRFDRQPPLPLLPRHAPALRFRRLPKRDPARPRNHRFHDPFGRRIPHDWVERHERHNTYQTRKTPDHENDLCDLRPALDPQTRHPSPGSARPCLVLLRLRQHRRSAIPPLRAHAVRRGRRRLGPPQRSEQGVHHRVVPLVLLSREPGASRISAKPMVLFLPGFRRMR